MSAKECSRLLQCDQQASIAGAAPHCAIAPRRKSHAALEATLRQLEAVNDCGTQLVRKGAGSGNNEITIVKHGFNLIRAVDRDNDRAAARGEFAGGYRQFAAFGPQRRAAAGVAVESGHGNPGIDQPRGQRGPHQAEPDYSDWRKSCHERYRVPGYWGSIPAALASAVQRMISLLMKLPNSAGGIVETITPTLASFCLVAGIDKNFSLSA